MRLSEINDKRDNIFLLDPEKLKQVSPEGRVDLGKVWDCLVAPKADPAEYERLMEEAEGGLSATKRES